MTEVLLRRPVPYPDESLRGYLIRLAQVNHTSPRKLYKLSSLFAGVDPKSLLMTTGKSDLSKLCILTNSDEQHLLSLTFFNQLGKYANEDEPILRHISSFGTCSTAFCQVCPQCLSEQPYHRKLWEIRSVTTCPAHHCRLISKCPECHRFISPIRKFVTHCKCKFDYRECKITKVPEYETKLALILNEKLFNKQVINTLLSADIQELSFRHFLYLHILFCYYFYQISTSKVKVHYSEVFKPIHLHETAIETFHMFTDWPNSFYNFVNRYRKVPKNFKGMGIMDEFGMLFYQIIKHLESNEFRFVLKSLRDYCDEVEMSTINMSKIKIKLDEAMRPLNLRQMKIDLVHDKEKYISLKKAEMILGIPDYFVEDLIRMRELSVVKWGRRYCEIKSLDKFKKCFEKSISLDKSILSNSDLVFFENIPKVLNYRIRTTQFIVLITRNKIQPCATLDERIGFQRLVFRKSDIESMFRQLGYISIYEVSKILNVQKSRISCWRTKGFIKGYNKNFYKVSDLEQFVHNYIPLTTLMKMHPTIVCGKNFYKWLEKRGVEPVSGPTKDEGGVYLYQKSSKLMEIMGLKSWD